MGKKIAFTSSYLSTWGYLPESEKRICRELKKLGAEVIVFNIDDLVYSMNSQISILAGKKDIAQADILFVRRARYREKETFHLAQLMGELGKTIIDSPDAFTYPVQKFLTDPHLYEKLYYPRTVYAEKISKKLLDIVKKTGIKFPCVIKPQSGTRQRGVVKVKNQKEFLAYPEKHQKDGIIVQEYIPVFYEYRVLTVGKKSLGAVKKKGDVMHRRKSKASFEYVKNAEIERFALQMVKHLPGDIYGLDIGETKEGEMYLFEANRNPVFVNFKEKSGLNIEAEIAKFILEKHKKGKKKTRI